MELVFFCVENFNMIGNIWTWQDLASCNHSCTTVVFPTYFIFAFIYIYILKHFHYIISIGILYVRGLSKEMQGPGGGQPTFLKPSPSPKMQIFWAENGKVLKLETHKNMKPGAVVRLASSPSLIGPIC